MNVQAGYPACAVLAAALLCAALISAGEAQAARRCPSFKIGYNGGSLTATHVRVARGHVSCRTVRRLFRKTYRGDGEIVPGPGRDGYRIEGWYCGTGAGGVVCWKNGTTYENARTLVSAWT